MVNLYEVLDSVEYEIHQLGKDVVIQDIATHSKDVSNGTMFVAMVGEKVDGHSYLGEVCKKGANIVVVNSSKLASIEAKNFSHVTVVVVDDTRVCLSKIINHFYKNPSKHFTLVGVTGTNGKTSVTKTLQHLFMKQSYKTGLIGTIDNYIDDEILSIEKTTPTTPDCVELGKIMDSFVKAKARIVLMEVSSMALKTYRVDGCSFDIGVFTNISPEHLDNHKTMEDYVNSKLKLFDFVPKAVINMDDEYSSKVLERFHGYSVKYGIYNKNQCCLYAKGIKFLADEVHFHVVYKKDEESHAPIIELPMVVYTPSEFAIYNNLAAIGVGIMCGLELPNIVNALSKKIPIEGRYEVLKGEEGITVIIDFAHTPVALENLLKAVRKNESYERIITVFGCGGDRDRSKRSVMGKLSGELSDFTIITSDNPRTEDPRSIIEEIVRGFADKETNFITIEDRKEGIEYAISIANVNDVIVIAGKGHERVQIFNGYSIPFSDKEVAMNGMKL